MAHTRPLGARAQLTAALVPPLLTRIEAGSAAADARRSAVLVLFGAKTDRALFAQEDLGPEDLDLLLEVRADTLRAHPGEVSFPGGGREEGDADAVATALREAQEETGLDPSAVEVIATLDEIPLAAGNFLVAPVIAWRTRNVPLQAMDQRETREVHLTPVAHLLDPANRFTIVYRHALGVYRGPGFDIGGATLWGFTAMVVDALFDAAGWTKSWNREREVDISRLN